jgi:hypothetical protein
MNLLDIARSAVKAVPEVYKYLSPRARVSMKVGETGDYDGYLIDIEKLVKQLYAGGIGADFKEKLRELIKKELTAAYNSAWFDLMNTEEIPDYLDAELQAAIEEQYSFVNQYYEDIVRDRGLAIGLTALLARAALWANKVPESYNNAVMLTAAEEGVKPETPIGENLMWMEGDTEKKCSTCLSLDGIVASARDWLESGLHPQMAPNDYLECGGWKCQCRLVPTLETADANAPERLSQIAAGR